MTGGVGWYRRVFELPRGRLVDLTLPAEIGCGNTGCPTLPGWGTDRSGDERLGLCLAGIANTATVWINGVEIASESPSPQRFASDITRLVGPGANTITIRAPDRGIPCGILQGAWLDDCADMGQLIRGEHAGKTARSSVDWVRDAVVYEVYLRSFSPEGTFRGLRERLDDLRQLGVTVIWLMPIHPIGRERRKGTLGCPYSISDYYGINPEHGTLDDFKSLLAAVHDRGMRLVIDLVINHTAWDHPFVRQHPDWYARDGQGRIRPPLDDWTDVAQLDYSAADLRSSMTEMMLHWLRDVGVDGFRCDVAGMIPLDFWNDVRPTLDIPSPVLMLAEDDQPAAHVHAFDLTYDWWTYQALGRLRAGRLSPKSIVAILANEEFDYPAGSLRVRFSSNHDLCAWHRPAIERYGPEAAAAAAVLTFALPGVPLIYNGQEIGNPTCLPLFERVPIDWRPLPDADLRGLYGRLARLRRDHPALRRGSAEVLGCSDNPQILVIRRRWEADTACALFNTSLTACEVRVEEFLPAAATAHAGAATPQGAAGAKTVNLPPLGWWIGTCRG